MTVTVLPLDELEAERASVAAELADVRRRLEDRQATRRADYRTLRAKPSKLAGLDADIARLRDEEATLASALASIDADLAPARDAAAEVDRRRQRIDRLRRHEVPRLVAAVRIATLVDEIRIVADEWFPGGARWPTMNRLIAEARGRWAAALGPELRTELARAETELAALLEAQRRG